MRTLKFMRALLIATLLAGTVQSATAGLDEGKAAYKKGDFSTAVREMLPLAKNGDVTAQLFMGLMYAEGKGVPQSASEAFSWYHKAAEQGHTLGQYSVGYSYRHGQGVSQDSTQAVIWFRKAADQGDLESQDALGMMYRDGNGVPQDYNEAATWFQKAANQGLGSAQSNLSELYLFGRGVPKDFQKSISWARKSAALGDAHGQGQLGYAYAKGVGVTQDYKEAIAWFTKAAEQGEVNSQTNLARMYFSGQGLPEDPIKGMNWLRKAAAQGYAPAQAQMANAFASGYTVDVNLVVAYALYNLAASVSSDVEDSAIKSRTAIAEKMTRSQIQDGQNLTRDLSKPGNFLPALDAYVESVPRHVTTVPTVGAKKAQQNTRGHAASEDRFPPAPAREPGRISCQTRCINADCYRTYDDGRKVRFEAKSQWNVLNNQFEVDAGPC